MVRQGVLLFGLMIFCQSCYFEPATQDGFDEPGNDKIFLDPSVADCRFTTRTGCLQGQIPSAPDLVVEGQNFFDADDLGLRFRELVKLKDDEGNLLSEQDYEVQLLTKVTNETLAKDFRVYIKGSAARAENVLSNGTFSVHLLNPGLYQVRVQKALKFVTIDKRTGSDEWSSPRGGEPQEEPSSEEGASKENADQPSAKQMQKSFCGTLYAESSVEVVPHQKSETQVFDHFSLHVKNIACDESKTDSTELTF